MKIKKSIAISESGFVFNPATGDSYSVNPIGAFILENLKQGKSAEETLQMLMKIYEVKKNQAEEDLEDFFGHLKQLNLAENG